MRVKASIESRIRATGLHWDPVVDGDLLLGWGLRIEGLVFGMPFSNTRTFRMVVHYDGNLLIHPKRVLNPNHGWEEALQILTQEGA
jgi:hypothetical protein